MHVLDHRDAKAGGVVVAGKYRRSCGNALNRRRRLRKVYTILFWSISTPHLHGIKKLLLLKLCCFCKCMFSMIFGDWLTRYLGY